MRITVEQLPVGVILPACDRRIPLTKGHSPHVGGAPRRAMPSQNPLWIAFEQHLERLRREAPVVARISVDVKVEGTANEQNPVRPGDAMDFLAAAPEARHMRGRTHGN